MEPTFSAVRRDILAGVNGQPTFSAVRRDTGPCGCQWTRVNQQYAGIPCGCQWTSVNQQSAAAHSCALQLSDTPPIMLSENKLPALVKDVFLTIARWQTSPFATLETNLVAHCSYQLALLCKRSRHKYNTEQTHSLLYADESRRASAAPTRTDHRGSLELAVT